MLMRLKLIRNNNSKTSFKENKIQYNKDIKQYFTVWMSPFVDVEYIYQQKKKIKKVTN